MKTAVFYHPDCLLHEMGNDHPEQPSRVKVIAETLQNAPFRSELTFIEALDVTREQLLLVHDPDYVNFIFQNKPELNQYYQIDEDTMMNAFTLAAAKKAAGAVVQAVDWVMEGKVKNAFCNVRPPGHHAEKAKAMGFCFFNNIAVGVEHALHHYALNRVAIIDFDVHHGNGTEDIFQGKENILLCSSFQHPLYPYSNPNLSQKNILNIPLATGSAGDDLEVAAKSHWLPVLYDFKPEMIFISAGFDAFYNDPLANLNFTAKDYQSLTYLFKKVADDLCLGRIVSVLEGGYDLTGLKECVSAHVGALVISDGT